MSIHSTLIGKKAGLNQSDLSFYYTRLQPHLFHCIFQNVASSLIDYYSNKYGSIDETPAEHQKPPSKNLGDSGSGSKPMRYIFLLGILPMVITLALKILGAQLFNYSSYSVVVFPMPVQLPKSQNIFRIGSLLKLQMESFYTGELKNLMSHYIS